MSDRPPRSATSGQQLQLATGTAEVLASLRRHLCDAGTVTAPLPPSGPERAQTLAMLQPERPVTEPDAAAIVATSGSTGHPRGVVLPRAALIASAEATAARLGGHGSWLLALPPHYVAGLMVLVRAVVGDRPVHSVDGRLTGLADLVERELNAAEGPRYTALVPTQLSRALADPILTRALAGFDAVLLGGAAADPTLLDRASTAGIPVVTTYGMSETCGGCVYDGLPLGGVSVSTDDQGRISIGGPTLFAGYRLDPAGTADALVDGRLLTRDRGQFIGDRLMVLGRLDDVVVSGGMNVDLAAVERALLAWLGETGEAIAPDDVRRTPQQWSRAGSAGASDMVGIEAAVVGVPHPDWGTEVVAVIGTDQNPPVVSSAPPDSDSATETRRRLVLTELRHDLSAVLPHYALPRRLVIRALPRTSGGKIDRRRLIADLHRPVTSDRSASDSVVSEPAASYPPASDPAESR